MVNLLGCRHALAIRSFPNHQHCISHSRKQGDNSHMTLIDDTFNALFFGSGYWLGIMIVLLLSISICLMWKYAVPFVVLADFGLELRYYDYYMATTTNTWAITNIFILLMLQIFLVIWFIDKLHDK
jgi:uncharacterized oligopeptide transporter (OPT) family protein